MRKIITYFINYPVAVNIVIIAIVLFGIVGLLSIKSSFFPLVDSNLISINVAYPGASPQEIEEGVILKIEDNLRGLVGIDRITSSSRENSGSITIEIMEGEDIDVILTEVKNAVDRVPSYPSGMEPLVVAKQQVMRGNVSFAVNGENIPLQTLKEYARIIENDLRGIDGISQVTLSGFPNEEIEIAVQEEKLLAYNLTFQQIAAAVSTNNLLLTGGNIKTDAEDYLIRANNKSYYADELDNLIVYTDPSGTTVRLNDIAVVRDRFSESPNATYLNGKLAVTINISNTNNEDLISSAESINNYIEDFNAKYSNVSLDIIRDPSITLIQRTELLIENASIGICLVLLFLSLFLNIRLAFWVAFGLPIAFFGMFIFASGLGVTINILSLFGMIIVIGILVDDGIVIAENIYHHYEKGKGPVQAAIDGTMEVIPPIVSAIITTILAFSVFLFLDGRVGEFFGEVSIVVILTLSISLVEALIILPAHIAHSKALTIKKEDRLKKGGNIIFKSFRYINHKADIFIHFIRDTVYLTVLRFALKNRFFTISIISGIFILTLGALGGGIIRTTFFPALASDQISIELKMPEGTNVAITDSIISMIEEKSWEVNKDFTARQTGNQQVVENIIKQIGPGTANANLQVNLLPGENRDFPSFEITNAIRKMVGTVYGVESLVYGSGGNFGGSPVSVSLLGNDMNELSQAKVALKSELNSNPLLKDVSDNDPAGIKEIKLKLKENAYLLGLNYQQVFSQVRNGFFGFQAQRFQRGQDEIRVWVRFDKQKRSSIQNLDDMRIVTPTGQRVPLREIAEYEIERGVISINHLDGLKEIRVSADMVNPKESATDVMADIRNRVLPAIQAQYPSVVASYEGQNREASKLTNSANFVLPVFIFLIYATIAFTFRSYGQPFLLISMVPLAIIGVAWGHYIHGLPINILSWLGIIALIGIMVNDGLVLIGKFNSYLKQGMGFDTALFEAGKSRFRAIFLTSLTTIAGLAPLILEKSRQAQFLIPMAVSIAYGIAIATILTLLLLPMLLSLSNDFKVATRWLFTGKKLQKEEVERAIIELKTKTHEA